MIHQGIHNLPLTQKQVKYNTIAMNSTNQKPAEELSENQGELHQKISLLEKQLKWEKLRADALDTMINIAEKQLDISIRKKSGTQQSGK